MFKTSRRVLFGDCDPAGVVYTPRIAHYVVEACLDFQTHLLGAPAPRSFFALGILPPARNLCIDFLAPLHYDEEIDIVVSVSSMGATSFTCSLIAAKQDGNIAFKATFTQVCVDPSTKRPIAIPQPLASALQINCPEQNRENSGGQGKPAE
ncbi:MAG TPA: thioesterase family protein [Tahibacter sp.]|uniref:acyl-CoA thioesterase n=1 Tax=Tahibacter sp. TaxID=2056211 RepID=UPI002BC3B312|nr:thioesterase family protein [Tahibacter sp.]HSX59674.1 thioesterase family protein [Tahibacter sp.]